MKQNNFIDSYFNQDFNLNDKVVFNKEQTKMLLAKSYMRKGDFLKALEIFNNEDLQDDILVIVEKLACLYQISDFYNWNKEVSKFSLMFLLKKIDESQYNCIQEKLLLMISKYFEEAGCIDEALFVLEKLKDLSFPEESCLANRLRIHMQYQIDLPDKEAIYNQLLSWKDNKSEKSELNFEIQQSLSIYEAYTFGTEMAVLRFEKTLQSTHFYVTQDINLIYIDLLEASLTVGKRSEYLIEKCKELSDLNIFETSLLKISQQIKIEDWPFLMSKMSKANALRILRLENIFEGDIRLFIIHNLNQLGQKNKKIWKKYLSLPHFFETEEISLKEGVLSFGMQKASVNGLIEKFVTCFLKNNESISTDEAIQIIWSESPQEYHYDRIKTLTNRVNKVFYDLLDFEKFFTFSKEQIKKSHTNYLISVDRK